MGVGITEIYSPERVAQVARTFGLVSGSSMDLTNGCDFNLDDHKRLAWNLIISRVGEQSTGFAGLIEPNSRAGAIARVLGTSDRRLVHVGKAAGKRCLSGTGFSNGRIVRVSSTA